MKSERGPALIQVYTGSGKGKTTAAVGLAVRALGQGMKVLMVRFLKPVRPLSGEVAFLQGVPGVDILTSGIGVLAGRPDPGDVACTVRETFAEARRTAPEYDLVILDEINNAVHRGFLPLEDLLAFLDHRPTGVEIVLTGRHAHPAVVERADLVSRVDKEKHPLEKGVAARRGIEF